MAIFFLCSFFCSLWALWVYCLTTFHCVMVSSLGKFWVGLLVLYCVMKDISQRGGVGVEDKKTKIQWWKKVKYLVVSCYSTWFFKNIDYSHLSVVFGMWTTSSIDGGKMPLDWKLYDLEKLINFQCAMSFNRGNKGSKVVCRMWWKTLGVLKMVRWQVNCDVGDVWWF
jgi:hypothetical protein